MAILFSVVSRGKTILAKHAACVGNFGEVTEQVLATVVLQNEGNKVSYSHGRFLFHSIIENGIVYLCITDEETERSTAFAFLEEIKRKFMTTYGHRAQTALPYAMNSDFPVTLAAEMKAFSQAGTSKPSATKLDVVKEQVDELKSVAVRNIDSLSRRGERLELLIDRSANLEANAVSFRNSSGALRKHLFWKNIRIAVYIGIAVLVLLFIVVTASCGGFTYHKCK